MGHEKLDYAQEGQAAEVTPWLQTEKEVGQGGTGRPCNSYKALSSLLSPREKPTWLHGSSQVFTDENFKSSL